MVLFAQWLCKAVRTSNDVVYDLFKIAPDMNQDTYYMGYGLLCPLICIFFSLFLVGTFLLINIGNDL